MSAQRPNETKSARTYILGNGGALYVGLIVCYAALYLTGSFDLVGWDFFLYYAASRLVVDGLAPQIYNLQSVGHMEHALAPHYIIAGGVLQNVYSPVFTVALAPFAVVPYTVAYFLWLALNCGLSAASLYYIERYAGLHGRSALLFRVAAVLSLPVVVALLQGQTSLLFLAILTACFWALRSDREVLAGICLGLTLVKPQYAPAFLVLLTVRRRWRALLSFAATGVASLLVTLPFIGAPGLAQYFRVILSATKWGSDRGGFSPVYNRGFFGLAQLLLSRPESTIVGCVLALLCIAVLVYVAHRCKRIDLPFAFATVIALLISPHVLIHDLSLLLLPAGIALYHRALAPHLAPILGWGYAAILAGFGVALAIPLQLSVFAMVGLSAWLLIAALRESAESPVVGGFLAPSTVHPC